MFAGFKTFAVSFGAALLGVLNEIGVVNFGEGRTLIAMALIMALLRTVTNTGPGRQV